jgi:hypothetical protein
VGKKGRLWNGKMEVRIYRIEAAGPALKAGRATLDSTADDMTWERTKRMRRGAVQMGGQQQRSVNWMVKGGKSVVGVVVVRQSSGLGRRTSPRSLRNCAKSGMAALWHLCTATMSPI